MQIMFEEDEREQIIMDLGIRIKEGCPEALRKKIKRKIRILEEYERKKTE